MEGVMIGQADSSQLFLLRLWADEEDDDASVAADQEQSGGCRMRGKITHVLSGKSANFNDEHALLRLLAVLMLPGPINQSAGDEKRYDS